MAAFLAALRAGATTSTRRCRRRRPRGRWSRCAGCTGSRVREGLVGRRRRPPRSARPRRPAGCPRPSPVGRRWSACSRPPAPARRAAGAARPGAAGAAVRHRRAHLRGGRPGRRRHRRWTAATVLLRGKGGKERMVPVGGYAVRRCEAYLVRARPGLAVRRRGATRRRCSCNVRGGRLSRQGAWTVLRRGRRARRRGRGGRGLAAHAAALLRHPPAGRRGRRPRGAGTAGPRLGDHHPGLHAGHGRPAARGVRDQSPAGAGLTAARPPLGRSCAEFGWSSHSRLSQVAMSTRRAAASLGTVASLA